MPKAKEISSGSNVVTFHLEGRSDRESLNSLRATTDARQLELGFNADRVLVFVSTESIHGSSFLRTLIDLRPTHVLDLRHAPHFNFTAMATDFSRTSIEKLGAKYHWRSVAFHEHQHNLLRYNPQQIAEQLLAALFRDKTIAGPVVVLFQDTTDAKAFGPYLIGEIERIDNMQWKGVWPA